MRAELHSGFCPELVWPVYNIVNAMSVTYTSSIFKNDEVRIFLHRRFAGYDEEILEILTDQLEQVLQILLVDAFPGSPAGSYGFEEGCQALWQPA